MCEGMPNQKFAWKVLSSETTVCPSHPPPQKFTFSPISPALSTSPHGHQTAAAWQGWGWWGAEEGVGLCQRWERTVATGSVGEAFWSAMTSMTGTPFRPHQWTKGADSRL